MESHTGIMAIGQLTSFWKRFCYSTPSSLSVSLSVISSKTLYTCISQQSLSISSNAGILRTYYVGESAFKHFHIYNAFILLKLLEKNLYLLQALSKFQVQFYYNNTLIQSHSVRFSSLLWLHHHHIYHNHFSFWILDI